MINCQEEMSQNIFKAISIKILLHSTLSKIVYILDTLLVSSIYLRVLHTVINHFLIEIATECPKKDFLTE